MTDEQNKFSFLNAFTPAQTFLFGVIGGMLVLCTIGFFVLLAVVLKGGGLTLSISDDKGGVGVSADDSPAVTDSGPTNAPKLVDVANQVGLDVSDWKSCITSQKFADKIRSDEQEAQSAGGNGTPYSVVIGPKGETVPISGAYPYEVVEYVVKKLLGQNPSAPAGVPESQLPTVVSGISVRPFEASREVVKGANNAKVTVVEYSDFECPFCKRFHPTMNRIIENYGDKVRWVYRHFPLDQLHSKARTEALASECAREQGKFWEFADALFAITPSNNGMDVTL